MALFPKVLEESRKLEDPQGLMPHAKGYARTTAAAAEAATQSKRGRRISNITWKECFLF